MDAIVPISGGALWSTQGFYFGSEMLSIIESCAGWDGGDYSENPKGCAANALAVFIPFFYTREWWMRYIDSPEAYTKWRNTMGEYYFDIQDARDVYYRMTAEGLGWVGDTPGFSGDLAAVLRSIKAKTLFLANPQDQFVPKDYVTDQVKMIANAQVVWIESVAGHMICCNGDPNATRKLGEALRSFLDKVSAGRKH